MSRNANYFKIGLFVILAVVILIASVIALGAREMFEEKLIVESYFKESVQGLAVGSPIKYRGVELGNVEEIAIARTLYDTERKEQTGEYIVVRFSIFPKFLEQPNARALENNLAGIEERGLRIQLAQQGITGTAFLAADYFEDGTERFPPYEFGWKPAHPYIPSAPSTFKQIAEAADDIINSIEDVADNLNTALQKVTQTLEDADVGKAREQLGEPLEELKLTVAHVDEILVNKNVDVLLEEAAATAMSARKILNDAEEPLGESLDNLRQFTDTLHPLSEDIPATVAELRDTLKRVDRIVTNQQHNIEVTIENVRQISQDLKELTENAKVYPSQVLFGGPPAQSK